MSDLTILDDLDLQEDEPKFSSLLSNDKIENAEKRLAYKSIKKKELYEFQKIITALIFKRFQRGKHVIGNIPTRHGKTLMGQILA